MSEVFGKKLGQYVLLEQLGEGGMAKVYNALDTRTESNVAIKVILPSKHASSVFLQQFEREAKTLANLTHTNIVKVLNYGIQDRQPYLVMEYASGGTLKEAMGQKMPWQTAAAILAPIARALDYVHRQQIVHRDVKPSNILLHEDFRPMLSDFGIMKLIEENEEKVDSAISAGIGTPEYMPPEQGTGKEVDFRADIYSLGLVFYEMVTGQKPYTADSPMAIVIKHVTDQLPLPTRIDKNIPKYVERVILRAVQKNPRNRFISMGRFADALELIALGDKALVQKINRVSNEKEKRQRTVSIALLSTLLFVLILGTSLFAYNYFTAPQTTPSPITAVVTVQVTQTPVSNPTNTAPPPTEPPSTSASEIVSTISKLTLLGTPIAKSPSLDLSEIARWGIGGVNVVKWSPDGKTIALGTTSGIFLYDADTKAQTLFIDTQFDVVEIAFNPVKDVVENPHELAAGAFTGGVTVWDYTSGAHLYDFPYAASTSTTLRNEKQVTAISYTVDGKNIAIGYKNGVINYFPSKQTIAKVMDNPPRVEDLIVSPDNRFIYASNGGNDIDVWDIGSGKKNQTPDTPLKNTTPINNLRMSPDQQFLLAGGNRNSVYLWDLFDLKQVSSFPNLEGTVTDFDVSYDNKYVAIGLDNGGIKVFAIPAEADYSKIHQPLRSFNDYTKKILSVAFSPNAPIIASGNLEEGLKIRNVEEDGKEPFTLDQSMRSIDEIYFSSDGNWLASAHEDQVVRVWNVNDAKEAYKLDGYLPKGVPFSPNNKFLAYIYSPRQNRDDLIRVIDLETGEQVAELSDYIQKSFVQFRDDSKLLVMGDNHSAKIWDTATWEEANIKGGQTAGCGQYSTPESVLQAIISNAGIFFLPFDKKMTAMCSEKPLGLTMMYYFYQAHRIVFVLGANNKGDVWVSSFDEVATSRKTEETSYDQSSKIFLAGDQANGLYAYTAYGEINIKNINSGGSPLTIPNQDDYQYRVALLPGKNIMALGSRYGSIHIWTLP